MITTVTTAAPSTRLADVKAVLEDLGFDPGDETQLARIERLVDTASDKARQLANRVFAQERVTEEIQGFGHTILLLERTPVVEVHSVTFDGDALTDFSIHNAEAGQLFRRGGWLWTQTWHNSFIEMAPVPSGEENRFVVDYTGGYQLKSFPDSWTAPVVPPALETQMLPLDIEEFVVELVKSSFYKQERDPSLTAERIGDYSANYGSGANSPIATAIAEFVAKWGRYV